MCPRPGSKKRLWCATFCLILAANSPKHICSPSVSIYLIKTHSPSPWEFVSFLNIAFLLITLLTILTYLLTILQKSKQVSCCFLMSKLQSRAWAWFWAPVEVGRTYTEPSTQSWEGFFHTIIWKKNCLAMKYIMKRYLKLCLDTNSIKTFQNLFALLPPTDQSPSPAVNNFFLLLKSLYLTFGQEQTIFSWL